MSIFDALHFSKKHGLSIQSQQMVELKRLVKPDVYQALEIQVTKENNQLTETSSGFNVFRGSDMLSFCVNWAHNNPERN